MSRTPLKICHTCGREFLTPDDFIRNTSRWRICESGHLWFNCACNSTSMVFKGKHDWYDPASQLSGAARSVFNQLPAFKKLPRIPSYVMELQTLLEDESASAGQLAALTKRDPLLAAQLLKLANNQRAARGKKIESLAHAIAFMGLDTLKDLVQVAALRVFQLESRIFCAEPFWEEAFLVGAASELLGRRFGLELPPDEVYLAGSVCNLGKLVLAMCLPDTADQYARELDEPSTLGSWSQAEARHGGWEHTTLGEIGAMFWGLAPRLTEAIAFHHRWPTPGEGQRPSLAEVVGMANQLAHLIQREPGQLDEPLFAAYCARFALEGEQVDELVEELRSPRLGV